MRPFDTSMPSRKSGEPAGTRRSGNSRCDSRPVGGALNRRTERSASAGCFSEASSLVPTRMSMSGWRAVKSRSLGTKYSLAKNGCTEMRTVSVAAPDS